MWICVSACEGAARAERIDFFVAQRHFGWRRGLLLEQARCPIRVVGLDAYFGLQRMVRRIRHGDLPVLLHEHTAYSAVHVAERANVVEPAGQRAHESKTKWYGVYS